MPIIRSKIALLTSSHMLFPASPTGIRPRAGVETIELHDHADQLECND